MKSRYQVGDILLYYYTDIGGKPSVYLVIKVLHQNEQGSYYRDPGYYYNLLSLNPGQNTILEYTENFLTSVFVPLKPLKNPTHSPKRKYNNV